MIDIGVITGSGICEFAGAQKSHVVESRFGEAELAVFRAGPWTVGGIARHGRGHYHLPHTIPHRLASAVLLVLAGVYMVLYWASSPVLSGVPG